MAELVLWLRCGFDDQETAVRIPVGARYCFLLKFISALGPKQRLVQWILGVLSPGLKTPECEADHASILWTLKMNRALLPCGCMVWCWHKNRDNCTFVRFDILAVLMVKSPLFRDMTPCRLAYRFRAVGVYVNMEASKSSGTLMPIYRCARSHVSKDCLHSISLFLSLPNKPAGLFTCRVTMTLLASPPCISVRSLPFVTCQAGLSVWAMSQYSSPRLNTTASLMRSFRHSPLHGLFSRHRPVTVFCPGTHFFTIRLHF
jgi:hypothetical protein